jgi:hypothetical protein
MRTRNLRSWTGLPRRILRACTTSSSWVAASRLRSRGEVERRPRAARVSARGRPRLRPSRCRALAGRHTRSRRPGRVARLGPRRGGPPLSRRPDHGRIVGGQRLHGGPRDVRGLRQVGPGLVLPTPGAVPRPRGTRATHRACEHLDPGAVPPRLHRSRPRRRRARCGGLSSQRREREEMERGLCLPLMPSIPRANTNLTTAAIAERVAASFG